jgi:hypothetical protein
LKYVLPPIRFEQSLNIVPKLIRIAVIGLVLLIGYKGVQALIVPPPIDQQKIEKTVEEQGKENERRHQEEMAEIKAMRLGFAREYNKIGDVQQAQGDLKAALKSYSNSLAIRERLATSDPGNAGWQRDLSVVYGKLADAYRKSNETVKARDALAAGRAVIRKLVDQHPDQAQWKEDLAWFDARIAEREKTSPKKKPVR